MNLGRHVCRASRGLVRSDADGIDRSLTVAPIALKVHPPRVMALRAREISRVNTRRHDITAADHTLARRAGRNHDDPSIPGQHSLIIDYLIAVTGL